MQIKHERPEWVKNFQCEKNTEIKYINGHWYLYERSTKYDPELKRSRKVSGKLLGSITENGFVPKKEKGVKRTPIQKKTVAAASVPEPKAVPAEDTCVPPVKYASAPLEKKTSSVPSSSVGSESYIAGSYVLLEKKLGRLEEMLERHFPAIWKELLVLSLLRLESRDTSLFEERYSSSMLSRIYPDLDFSFLSLRKLSDAFSQSGDAMVSFFSDMAGSSENNASCTLSLHGYMVAPIVELDVMVPFLSSFIPYPGSDVNAVLSQILSRKKNRERILVSARKEELRKEDIKNLTTCGCDYVLRLKRDGKVAMNLVPALDESYMDSFDAQGRSVLYSTFTYDDYEIHVFKDIEKRNKTRRVGKKGSKTVVVDDGISIYRTNRKGMNARQLYDIVLGKDRLEDLISRFLESKEELPPVFSMSLSLFIERLVIYLGQFIVKLTRDLDGVDEENVLELSKMIIASRSGSKWSFKASGKAETLLKLVK